MLSYAAQKYSHVMLYLYMVYVFYKVCMGIHIYIYIKAVCSNRGGKVCIEPMWHQTPTHEPPEIGHFA